MSHVVAIKTEVKDLEAVKALCQEKGWTFKQGQTTYQWWGRHAGDYPLPEGMKEEDLGKCSHAIGIPGTDWEVGLVHNPSTGGYKLAYDFYGHRGQPILEAIGENAGKFLQGYGVCKATIEAKRRGYIVSRQAGKNGAVKLVVTGM